MDNGDGHRGPIFDERREGDDPLRADGGRAAEKINRQVIVLHNRRHGAGRGGGFAGRGRDECDAALGTGDIIRRGAERGIGEKTRAL